MKSFQFLILLALILSGFTFAAYSQTEVLEVDATGQAAVKGSDAASRLKAHDEAVNRALRKAVEQGVGTVVDSETMVQNFQVLDDQIYSHVKGYVQSFEVIEDNEGRGDIYRVKVRAQVSMANLQKDLKARNLITSKKQNPRLMIVVSEKIEGMMGESSNAGVVQATLENEFINHRFPLVDQTVTQVLNSQNITAADYSRLAELGRKHDAEIVVLVDAVSTLSERSKPYGVEVFAYQANINARVVYTDTAKVVATTSNNKTERGPGAIPTAQKALRSCATEAASQLASKILEQWRDEVFNASTLKVVFKQITAEMRPRLITDLKAIRGVREVNERHFTGNQLDLDITVDGAIARDFEDHLKEIKVPALKLLSKTSNRLEYSVN